MNIYSRAFALKILFKRYWMTDRTILKSIAVQNPFNSKPWTTLDARSTSTALMNSNRKSNKNQKRSYQRIDNPQKKSDQEC
jgi:hypothetical protein